METSATLYVPVTLATLEHTAALHYALETAITKEFVQQLKTAPALKVVKELSVRLTAVAKDMVDVQLPIIPVSVIMATSGTLQASNVNSSVKGSQVLTATLQIS